MAVAHIQLEEFQSRSVISARLNGAIVPGKHTRERTAEIYYSCPGFSRSNCLYPEEDNQALPMIVRRASCVHALTKPVTPSADEGLVRAEHNEAQQAPRKNNRSLKRSISGRSVVEVVVFY